MVSTVIWCSRWPVRSVAQRRWFSSKVTVALSGGVDSSVAAALLQKNSNLSVSAIHMSNWNPYDDDSLANCTSENDWQGAVETAQHLSMPISRSSFEAEYWCQVFDPYIANLNIGLMGNPDFDCNTHVKFGCLLNECIRNDSKLATGHYARLWYAGNTVPGYMEDAATTSDDFLHIGWLRQFSSTPRLLAALDSTKDQSYFLAGCPPSAFHNVVFPLGNHLKNKGSESVRQLAVSLDLPSSQKRDSMGICFVGKRPSGYRDFIKEYLPAPTQKLQFIDVETRTVIHTTDVPDIAVLYTPGQGARIGGVNTKYFVVDNHAREKNVDEEFHTISVCAGTHHPALYSDSMHVGSMNWLMEQPPLPLQQSQRMRCQCRIRHLQQLVDCEIVADGSSIKVHFEQPMRGVTVGQMAVFYILDGLVCLGGGSIADRGATYFDERRELPQRVHPAGINDTSVTKRFTSTFYDAVSCY